MKPAENKTPPQKAESPQGELMKCPECGGDAFTMGKSVVSDEVRCWRVPDRWGAGIRVEEINPGGYDDLHIICRKCDTTFWDCKILEMWNAGGWWN